MMYVWMMKKICISPNGTQGTCIRINYRRLFDEQNILNRTNIFIFHLGKFNFIEIVRADIKITFV